MLRWTLQHFTCSTIFSFFFFQERPTMCVKRAQQKYKKIKKIALMPSTKIFTLSFLFYFFFHMQKLDAICNVDACLHPEEVAKKFFTGKRYDIYTYINSKKKIIMCNKDAPPVHFHLLMHACYIFDLFFFSLCFIVLYSNGLMTSSTVQENF